MAPNMTELQQLVSTFGAVGAIIWIMWQQHIMLKEIMAHNQQLIDRLIDKNGNGKTNGNGSNNPVQHT